MDNKYQLYNSWTLYFHEVNNDDWSLESYHNIVKINNLEEYFKLINTIPNITAGMFFLMKDDIKPMYEDINNKNGICLSIKASKINSNKIWKELVALIIGNNIVKNKDHIPYINGVSVSPKKFYGIIKIWIKNKKIANVSNFNLNINNIDTTQIIFK